jgi:hypothetical protein
MQFLLEANDLRITALPNVNNCELGFHPLQGHYRIIHLPAKKNHLQRHSPGIFIGYSLAYIRRKLAVLSF